MPIARNLSLLLIVLTLAACGQPPADQTAAPSSPPVPAPLLTADEAKVLLSNARVWKFDSHPGVTIKRVGIRFIEDGKATDRFSVQPGDDPTVTSILVEIEDCGNDRHLLKIYLKHGSSWSGGESDGWFQQHLTSSGGQIQTEAKPFNLGTMFLMGGSTAPTIPDQAITFDEHSPCRVELVIE